MVGTFSRMRALAGVMIAHHAMGVLIVLCPGVLQEMASRHRVRYSSLSIIKTATVPPALCKRDGTKQFHNSKIAFPVTQKLARCVWPAQSAALITLLVLCRLTLCCRAEPKHCLSHPSLACSHCYACPSSGNSVLMQGRLLWESFADQRRAGVIVAC